MKAAAVVAAVLIAAVLAGQWTVSQRKHMGGPAVTGGEIHRVAYVYDGDTIKLDNGERVRLIGIDAPESHDNEKLSRDVARRHTDRRSQLSMGREAAGYVRSLLRDREVRLEFDVERRDRYQRLLAYVYLSDGTFVNEMIIRQGYAYPLTIPPNVRHAHQFKQWFDEAREQKRGLWGRVPSPSTP